MVVLTMLTQPQLERQDFVDNAIFALLENLKTSSTELVWDIEMIADIRDHIASWLEGKNATQPQEFYPSVDA
jgi:hypothetical protein